MDSVPAVQVGETTPAKLLFAKGVKRPGLFDHNTRPLRRELYLCSLFSVGGLWVELVSLE